MTETKIDSKVIIFPSKRMKDTQRRVTFKQVALEWLFEEKKWDVKSRTLGWYYEIIEKHLFPTFGDLDVNDIQIEVVVNLINEMSLTMTRTTKKAASLFKRIMEYSIEKNYLKHNFPLHKIKVVHCFEEVELKYIPQQQRDKVIALASNNPILYPILISGMFLGMRPSELIALKWRHINLKNGNVKIIEALTYEVDLDSTGVKKKRSTISDTKTSCSMRRIKAPEIVLQVLKSWRLHCIKNEIFNPDGYVFVTRQGSRREYSGLTSLFKRFCIKYKSELEGLHITPHMLRHTCATMMLENKVNPRIVQQVLGHKDVQTTLNIYSHVSLEVLEEVAKKLNNIYYEIKSNSYNPKI